MAVEMFLSNPFSMETIQEASEILIFADIYGQISQFVSNG